MADTPTPLQIAGRQHQIASGSVLCDLSSTDVTFSGVIPIALRVDVAGTVKFTASDDTTDTWTCAGPDIIPVAVKKVFKTGTTATGIHALFAGGHG